MQIIHSKIYNYAKHCFGRLLKRSLSAHSHFQTPLENPSIQTHLVLLCCIKRLCIFGPKGAIQIRYYYYYY